MHQNEIIDVLRSGSGWYLAGLPKEHNAKVD